MHRSLAEAVVLFEAGLGACRRAEDRALVASYLGTLAPILAAAVLGENVLARLNDVEGIFGNTWLIDEKPFSAAFEKWRQFRSEYEEWALSVMTVNERLNALSLSEAYDRAVESRDPVAIRSILERAGVDETAIKQIIDRCVDGA